MGDQEVVVKMASCMGRCQGASWDEPVGAGEGTQERPASAKQLGQGHMTGLGETGREAWGEGWVVQTGNIARPADGQAARVVSLVAACGSRSSRSRQRRASDGGGASYVCAVRPRAAHNAEGVGEDAMRAS